MDRRMAYIGAIPQDLDALKPQRNTMVALGYLAQGVLGTDSLVDGLNCTPSVPASLVVNIGAGQVYTLATVDDDAFGSLAADNQHQIIKQGILLDPVAMTLTPPGTPGQAVNYLVQVQLLERDIDTAVIPYFNPASLTNPNAVAWSGPNNSGVSQPLTRQQTVVVSLKPGVAATAGSQVTPAPDPGYIGLYAITVAQGATQITGSNIAIVDNAPFIWLKLPEVPGWVQGGSYAWAEDTSASANAIAVTLDPLPQTIGKGFGIRCKVANATTGATTITINRKSLAPLGPYAVVKATGGALTTDIQANQVVDLVFDGTSFRDITGTTVNNSVGNLNAQSGEGITVLGDGTVNLNYPGLASDTPQGPDLFSFYSQGDTHHRVLTYAQLLALLGANSGYFLGIEVITTSGTWTKPSGVGHVLALATGPGGAGGGIVPASAYSAGAGGGAGATAIAYVDLTGVASVPVNIGTGGAGVAGQSGNGGNGSTSFGTYAVAGPGGGGHGADVSSINKWGGAPGVATAGAMQMKGGGGQPATAGVPGTNWLAPGNGGASFWNGGARGANAESLTNTAAGEAGQYGSGGGGAYAANFGSAQPGGNGGDGVILLLKFS